MNTENTTPPASPPASPPADPRRRMRELLAIPERDRTDAQWDELNELEIQFAPGNRATGGPPGPVGVPRPYPQGQKKPKGDKGGGGGGGGGGGKGGGKNRPPRPHKQRSE